MIFDYNLIFYQCLSKFTALIKSGLNFVCFHWKKGIVILVLAQGGISNSVRKQPEKILRLPFKKKKKFLLPISKINVNLQICFSENLDLGVVL